MMDEIPVAPEAETAVIGAVMLGADAPTLTQDQFWNPQCRDLWAAIIQALTHGDPLDPIALGLSEREAATATAAMASTPAVANVEAYAAKVREAAWRRELIAQGQHITSLGRSDKPIAAAIDEAERSVMSIADPASQRVTDLPQSLRDVLDDIEARDPDVIRGAATGLRDLDRLLGGLHPGSLTVIGARPAMGKSSLALGIAAHVALSAPVLVCSLEMSHMQLTERILAATARVSASRLSRGGLRPDEWEKIAGAVSALADLPLLIDDDPSLTVGRLAARARRSARSEGGLGLVVVDYLQLMSGDGENRQAQVAEISRGLKGLARDLNVPVLALSQLSRGVEQRIDKRPTLADLRESGAIEQDADTVAFLYRDEVYNPESQDRGTAEVIVAKRRSGPTGVARVAWLGDFTTFADLARV